MFKINKCRVGTFLCPRGYQSAWADDKAACPPYDYLENKFTVERGFTMVELISVIVISGILAAIAAPRFFNATAFEGRNVYNQVLSTLRSAQQEAIAMHRFVCVAFASNSVTVAYDATSPSASYPSTACSSTTPLTSPSGDSAYSISSTYASFSPVPSTFYFHTSGKPSINGAQTSTAQTITLVDNSGTTYTITVEAETGYVH